MILWLWFLLPYKQKVTLLPQRLPKKQIWASEKLPVSAAISWNVGQHIHFVTKEQNAVAPKLEASRQIALT